MRLCRRMARGREGSRSHTDRLTGRTLGIYNLLVLRRRKDFKTLSYEERTLGRPWLKNLTTVDIHILRTKKVGIIGTWVMGRHFISYPSIIVCTTNFIHQASDFSAALATRAIRAAPTPLPSFAIPIRIRFSPAVPISGISLKASRM